jgi:serine/threonine protein kinase
MVIVEAVQPPSTAPVDPPLHPGALLAPGYQVLTHVARGQALDVYEVFSDERLCSCIAKVVRPDRRQVVRVADRLRHEGEVLRRLGHPHLVRCWDVLEQPQLTVVLETIPGPTLEEAIEDRDQRMSATDLAHLGRHLCSALHYLHGNGVLHLDIRPANVMAQAGIARLIDLSLAGTPGPARRGRGTREYMAPEQARGDDVSAATDVWGVGATLYEAATGEAPFAPLDEAEHRFGVEGGYLQLRRPAPPFRYWGRRLPRTLGPVIERCLAADPAARPGVDELYTQLQAVLEEASDRTQARADAVEGTEDAGHEAGAGSSRR